MNRVGFCDQLQMFDLDLAPHSVQFQFAQPRPSPPPTSPSPVAGWSKSQAVPSRVPHLMEEGKCPPTPNCGTLAYNWDTTLYCTHIYNWETNQSRAGNNLCSGTLVHGPRVRTAGMLQRCSRDALGVLQGYSIAPGILHGCSRYAPGMLH